MPLDYLRKASIAAMTWNLLSKRWQIPIMSMLTKKKLSITQKPLLRKKLAIVKHELPIIYVVYTKKNGTVGTVKAMVPAAIIPPMIPTSSSQNTTGLSLKSLIQLLMIPLNKMSARTSPEFRGSYLFF